METWVKIHWCDRYEVSDLGRVRSVDVRLGGRVLKQELTDRYPRVCLMTPEGKKITRRVHVLVLEAFKGPRPVGQVGRHLDDNPLNCVLSNLEWGTHKQNAEDRKATGSYKCGGAHPLAKLTDSQVLEIRSDPRYRYKPAEYAEKFGVSKGAVIDARNRVTFRHL